MTLAFGFVRSASNGLDSISITSRTQLRTRRSIFLLRRDGRPRLRRRVASSQIESRIVPMTAAGVVPVKLRPPTNPVDHIAVKRSPHGQIRIVKTISSAAVVAVVVAYCIVSSLSRPLGVG